MDPDLSTLRKIPWNKEPTAQIICDLKYGTNEPSEIAPRQVLINVINELEKEGLKAIVAPELSFICVNKS